MTGGEGPRVERLFAAALELPTDQRERYVREASQHEPVRREVLTLLEAHGEHGPFDTIAEWVRGFRPSGAMPPVGEALERLERGLGGRYRIGRELGRGGTAIVLMAEDLRHRRKVALKVLHSQVAVGLGPTRFLQEIALAAPLAHPHILPLYDSGEAGGLLYYVMPYVEGESLRTRLTREGRLSLEEALHIVRQVADALEYAHGRGVVHCDIKPGNIMLHAGHAVVADFGIARAMAVAGRDALEALGFVQGTPAYMSPEQRIPGSAIGPGTDVYSLGCVLYEMLVGGPPSPSRSARDLGYDAWPERNRILEAAEVPRPVRTVLRRSLADEPADRFPSAAELREALPPYLPKEPVRRRWSDVVLVSVAVLSVAALAVLSQTRPSSVTHPAAAMIAVLPLAPTTPDPALLRLGRDLVVTLSANLDGVGEIRALDAQAVLAQTGETSPPSLVQGSELAQRMGSSSVLHGSIVPVPPDVRIELGLFTTDSSRVLARVSFTGDPADLTSLTDSLTWRILRAIWRTRRPPTPNLAAVTTRSVPALRALLEGERASLEGRWDAATEAFARARREDPGFWLAHWRYAYARWWAVQTVEDSVLTPLHANRFSLPERDRLVLESWWSDTTALALDRSLRAVERFPDYWPAWMERADWLFHAGPLHGHEPDEAWAALERTVALNPNFAPAWEHLYWATIEADTTAAARALEALTRLGFGVATAEEYGYDVTRTYRAELEMARSSTLEGALLDSVAAELVTEGRGRLDGGATLGPIRLELSRRVLDRRPRPDLALIHGRQFADALAARGSWDSALVVMERHAARPVGADPLEPYRLAVVGAWLDAVRPEAAARLRPAAIAAVSRSGATSEARAELAWLDGLLAFGRRDRSALEAARGALLATGAPRSVLLGRSLEAFDRWLSGAPGRAARILAALDREGPDVLSSADEDHPYVVAVARLAAARGLHDDGRNEEALRAIAWFDALWALDGYRRARHLLKEPASLERATILAERRSRSGDAR